MKYGWEIADEVQRFVGNTSETEFVPKSTYDLLLADNKRMAALLKEWYDDDFDGPELLTRSGEALTAHHETLKRLGLEYETTENSL